MKITKIAAAIALAGAFTATQATADSYSFAGPYAGVSAGLTNFTTDTADYWCNYACDAPGNSELAVQATLTGGYNWQVDENFVLGVELDFSTGVDSSERIFYDTAGTEGATWDSELNWVMTLRGRAGISLNKTMLYVTGGLALADAEYQGQRFDPSPSSVYTAKFDGSVMGLVGGVGVEHALSDAMRLRIEYSGASFDKKNSCWADGANASPCWDTPPQNDDYVHWRTSYSSFRAGVNWNF